MKFLQIYNLLPKKIKFQGKNANVKKPVWPFCVELPELK